MKFFKRIISAFLVIVTIFLTCIGFSGCTGNPNDSAITRGEWISQLALKMGLDNYQSETKYFKDIDVDNEIFPYVQSCVEWEILTKEDGPYFYEDFKATKSFIVETIIRASTLLDNEEATKDDIIQCAIDNDIVYSKSKSNEIVQRKDLDDYVEKAYSLYSNKEFKEYNNVVLNDSVKDVSKYVVTRLDNDKYEVSNTDLLVNDIVILPGTKEYPSGIAKKITSISINDGKSIIITEDAALEEIYDSFEFAQKVTPSADNVILEEGVTLNESGDLNLEDILKKADEEELAYRKSNSLIQPLGKANDSTIPIKNTASFKGLTFNYSFTKGKPTISPSFNLGETELSATLSNMNKFNRGAFEECGRFFKDKTTFSFKNLPNFGTTKEGWEKTLYGGGKMTGGYDISGNIGFDSLQVETELKLKKALGIPYGIDYFKVDLGADAHVQTSFKGTIDHEIKIASTPIPTPIPGVTINVNFYALISAEGVITIKVACSENVTAEFKNGNWRNTKTSSAEASAEFAINVEFGPGIGLSINALSIEIIDVRLDAKGIIEASASVKYEVNENSEKTYSRGIVEIKADFFAPTLSLEIGTKNTLAKKIGISVKWDLVKKENTVFHKEIYNKQWILFENEEISEEETTENTNEFSDDLDVLGFQINTYAIMLAIGQSEKIEVTVPKSYSSNDVKWKSNDTSIATVDSNGNVTAVSAGSTTIIVSLDGTELQCAVMTYEE